MNQIPTILLVIILFICNYYLIQAQKNLSVEQKAILLDMSLIKQNFIGMIINFFGIDFVIGLIIICVGLICINFIATTVDEPAAAALFILGIPILFILVILISIWLRISLYKRLKASGLPESYLRTMLITNVVFYVSLAGYILTIAYMH